MRSGPHFGFVQRDGALEDGRWPGRIDIVGSSGS
jgi:hypothetical protein